MNGPSTKLRTAAAFAAGMILAASTASAAERRPHHAPLKIAIETVDHQRYSSVGDWQVAKDGSIHITVSAMSNQRYEFLVAAHELVEAYLAKEAGVSQAAVDKFDMAYEKRRKPGDLSEPGDDVRAPYHHQHQVASAIERQLADELGVNWARYDAEVSSK